MQGEWVPKDPVLIDISAQMSHLSIDSHLIQGQDHMQTHFWFKPGVCDVYYRGLILQPTHHMTQGVPQEDVGLQRFLNVVMGML